MLTPEETNTKLLIICVKRAEQLKDVQIIGAQDPYANLWVGTGGQKVKTKVHKAGGIMATWNETFMFNIEGINPNEHLKIEVKNKNVTDTRSIGKGDILLR
ncbi:unnamed protein product [Choristocarpus tenellus]